MINLLRQVYFFRDVAQLASAPRSGRGGRPFESDHPDIFSNECSLFRTTITKDLNKIWGLRHFITDPTNSFTAKV